jgi:hypothetical protein
MKTQYEPAENRLLKMVALLAVLLMGPVFVAGYALGSLSTPTPAAPQESKPATAATPAPAAKNAAKQTSRADHSVYLQLVATPEHEAMIGELHRSGFEAVASEIPNRPGVFRVLVGPVEPGDVSRTRANLESRGFPGEAAILRKQAF